MAFRYWCKLRGNKPVILFRMSAEGGEEVLAMQGWKPAPGSYEDILEGSFDYVPLPEDKARNFFPEGFETQTVPTASTEQLKPVQNMPLEHQQSKRVETDGQVVTAFVMHGRSAEEGEFFARNALHIRIDYMKYLVATNKLSEAAIAPPEDPLARKEFVAHLTTPLGATLEFLKRDSETKSSDASAELLKVRYRTSTYHQTTHFQLTLYKALQKSRKVQEEKERSRQIKPESTEDYEKRKQETAEEIKRLHNKHVDNAASKARAGKASLPIQLGNRGEYDFSDIWLVQLSPRGGSFPGHILEIRMPYPAPEEHYLTESEIQGESSHGNVAIQDEERTPKTGLRVKQTNHGGRMILKVDTVDKRTGR